MTLALLLVLYTLGGAVLAVWTDQRFPSLRPGFTKKLLLHSITVVVLAQLTPVIVRPLNPVTARCFGLLLLTYLFLVGLWVMRAFIDYTNSASGGGGLRDRA